MATSLGLFIYRKLRNNYYYLVETSYLSRCSCESHLATQLIDRTYSMPVERLFDCIFGDNDFIAAYHASRRIKGFFFFFFLFLIKI
jgi:hypothetical protein